MAKGMNQGTAWGLSLILSIMLFAIVLSLILSVKPSIKDDYSGTISADEEVIDSSEDEEFEIKSDDQTSSSHQMETAIKKKSLGRIRVKLDLRTGLS